MISQDSWWPIAGAGLLDLVLVPVLLRGELAGRRSDLGAVVLVA
jgi:hypothetical protein